VCFLRGPDSATPLSCESIRRSRAVAVLKPFPDSDLPHSESVHRYESALTSSSSARMFGRAAQMSRKAE
jgi:hypothetical protein